ncbi:phosphatase 2C-like domain-containing protein [Schizophyllum amplum]|uniref:Phosphatase 2C-like domain-containing protein n=1 Tax=Schizophyllum amplum TaxID=97359 RepID=A0A550C4S1_9AGAR|nr:phosphatase 2C-like domain-containing protein [Auriculariopsis ampla]
MLAGPMLAYAEDVPGNRIGPDDAPWPLPYQLLEEKDIWKELRHLAKPQSATLDSAGGMRADSVNFQPAPSARTQDRYAVKQLNINGRTWTLTGVFDGHLGDATVDHAAHHLPIIVREFLEKAHATNPARLNDPAFICDLFSRSIVAFDDAIAADVLDIFGGIEGLDNYDDASIRRIINDQHEGGERYKKTLLCMYGSTALVSSSIRPQELWVANLGDCTASMICKSDDGYTVERLTAEHNGYNDAELERIRREHPNEPDCVIDRRILGALAPTRCLATSLSSSRPFQPPHPLQSRPRISKSWAMGSLPPAQSHTPYITAQPEVVHRRLDARARLLVLTSDGFTDLCGDQGIEPVLRRWAAEVDGGGRAPPPGTPHAADNLALRLLRQALGGDDRGSVSRVLTLDVDGAWIDDTAIVVLRF